MAKNHTISELKGKSAFEVDASLIENFDYVKRAIEGLFHYLEMDNDPAYKRLIKAYKSACEKADKKIKAEFK